MKRLCVPTCGVSDWRRLLADPEKQWVRAASAMELAVSWERAQSSDRGLPGEVAAALDEIPSLHGAQLLIGFPEHKVALKGRGKASQNDVWALLKTGGGSISMAVEGKAGEPFASTIAEWSRDASDGKKDRLKYLCETLGAAVASDSPLRYQLFHRTASAIIEARRFGASQAVMLVQSFRDDPVSWSDFAAFSTLLGATPARGQVVEAKSCGSERLFVGWVDSSPASDAAIASVV